MVPKHVHALHLILKQFSHYKHIITLKLPTLEQVQQLTQQADYVFSVNSREADLHIPICVHHHLFSFCWAK